jgi:PiT family inorganic phosphate transporter
MGVGAAKNVRALRWELVERIIWTWILTIPATALISYALVRLLQSFN